MKSYNKGRQMLGGNKFKLIFERFKKEIRIYQLLLKDVRTPKLAKFFLWLAVMYVLSPVDLIPDWIPVIGHLDDLVIVPLLVWLAIQLIPATLLSEVRKTCESL